MEPQALGALTLPAILCADTSNSGDTDTWTFEPTPSGAWTVSLTYTGGRDQDVELRDAGGASLAATAGGAIPDSFAYTLVGGTLYQLVIDQPGGGPGQAYTVVIHQ